MQSLPRKPLAIKVLSANVCIFCCWLIDLEGICRGRERHGKDLSLCCLCVLLWSLCLTNVFVSYCCLCVLLLSLCLTVVFVSYCGLCVLLWSLCLTIVFVSYCCLCLLLWSLCLTSVFVVSYCCLCCVLRVSLSCLPTILPCRVLPPSPVV